MTARRSPGDPAATPASCQVEFFGPARLLAGMRSVTIEIAQPMELRRLIPALAARCPALDGPVLDPTHQSLVDGYIFNRNGRDFLVETSALVQPNDRLLLLSSLAGG
jgi:hypothetical protein